MGLLVTPIVITHDAWLSDTSTRLINIEVHSHMGSYHWPWGQAWVYAQVREDGAAAWEDKSAILMTSFKTYEEIWLHYASKRNIDVEVRGAVKYKGSLGNWNYKYGGTIKIHIPAEATDPYANTGSVYPISSTVIRAWAHGWPGNYDNNEIWVQYRQLGSGTWLNTSKTAATKNTLNSISKDITVTTSVDYEFRAALSYNAGAATVYGEIVVISTDDVMESLECETKPSGAGTEANPYIITDLCKLNWIGGDSVPDPKAARLAAWYNVGNNLDATETARWYWSNSRGVYEGFRPIGNSTTPFTGSFDGKGYAIYGLYIDSSRTDGVGLFAQMDGELALQNVYFRVVTVKGLYRAHPYGVGVVVGQMLNLGSGLTKPISNIRVTGADVEGLSYTGGIVGRIAIKVAMQDCSFQGKIIASGSSTGGIAGYVDHNTPNVATYQRLWSSVTILAGTDVGGLFGWFRAIGDPSLFQSFSVGTIKAHATAGGLVGTTYSGTHSNTHIKDCYSRVNVEITSTLDTAWAAGLLSRLDAARDHRVTNSYSTGTVTVSGSANAKGLIGYHIGGTDLSLIINCFWDTQASGQATSNGGTGKTTAQMKTKSTFTDAGWDFVAIWGIDPAINDGYPYLLATLYELTVLTLEPTDVATTQFTSRGELTRAQPNAYMVGFGYFKGTAGEPDTEDEAVYEEGSFGVGIFSKLISQLEPGESYRVRAFAGNTGIGTVWGNTITVVLEGGDLFPTDNMARVSSVRRIFKPGLYQMEIALGDLGFDIDVAELGVRKIVGEVEEPEHPSEDVKPEPKTLTHEDILEIAEWQEEVGLFDTMFPEPPPVSGKYTAPAQMPPHPQEGISIWDKPIMELIGLDKVYGAISSAFKRLFRL